MPKYLVCSLLVICVTGCVEKKKPVYKIPVSVEKISEDERIDKTLEEEERKAKEYWKGQDQKEAFYTNILISYTKLVKDLSQDTARCIDIAERLQKVTENSYERSMHRYSRTPSKGDGKFLRAASESFLVS